MDNVNSTGVVLPALVKHPLLMVRALVAMDGFLPVFVMGLVSLLPDPARQPKSVIGVVLLYRLVAFVVALPSQRWRWRVTAQHLSGGEHG